jgi:DNA-binding Lrp family transcriptional regulator
VVRAYVLINARVGTAGRVAAEAARAPGVTSAEVIAGIHDVVAHIEARTLDELGRIVVQRIQGIDGVDRTITCVTPHPAGRRG